MRAPRRRMIDICRDGAEPGVQWLKFQPQPDQLLCQHPPLPIVLNRAVG